MFSTARFAGDLDDLESALGSTFGPAQWLQVDQGRIRRFADATEDHQWIHVDTQRAAEGPFGTTIAHGYLTLSMIPHFLAELVDLRGTGMGINYGLNKVRFPAAVREGALIRAIVTVSQIRRSAAGAQVTYDISIEADHVEKPVCVAQVLVLYAA